MSLPRGFGPYTLLRRLAVGGMAEIYVAKTLGLGGFEKLTALKLVHPHLSADPQFVRMLVDEAKILVLLTHANIAQVFDLGSIDGTYYIAMEYVDGVDVQGLERAATRLGRALPISVCCFIVSEMLNGLDYAHRKRDLRGRPLGIVHRDISPQNVVVSRAGEVKLVDFGIAKTNLRVQETEIGVIKGKYGYMSPEQAWADPTDRRSDVFSAGVMLYELLTGKVLYQAKSVAELIGKVRRAEIPPPSEQRPDIPEVLSSVVMKALALEPSDRYQTALEMGDALREYMFRSTQPLSSARLGDFVVEVLEEDTRIGSEQTKSADETGGLHALRREEFVRNDQSVLYMTEQAGEETRTEGLPARARLMREGTAGVRRRDELGRDAAASLAADAPSDEQLTELWTERWLAQQGEIAPEIRVQNDARAASIPSLSWPPREDDPTQSARTPRTGSSAPSVLDALMPPRGADPSLGPLPRAPALPQLGGRRPRRFGLPQVVLLLLFVVLGALSARLVWESGPSSAIELLSDPKGAKVYINGALQPGVTPLRVSGLRRGATYDFRLELPGYLPLYQSFEASEKTERYTLQLMPEK
ncbi:MAG: serine/threonine-protein kinase [Polyangiales bacterium]